MKTVDSHALLAAYANHASEAAFRELVERYINLVYATALRLVNGDGHSAEDVTQMVFIDLARKAGCISSKVMLGGWLHRHTCHVAATVLRGERRRRNREKQAMDNNIGDPTPTNLDAIGPIVDEAVDHLESEDRTAIVLRFFEQRDFRAVGEALHVSEDAARMRVNRALAKLHSQLSHRGLRLATATLATKLAVASATAAPAGLASGIANAALTGVALGGGVSTTLMRFLTMAKIKGSIAAAFVVATLAIVLTAQHEIRTALAQARLREENEALRAQLAQSRSIAQLQTQPDHASGGDEWQLEETRREVLKLRGEVGRLRQQLKAASTQPVQAVESAAADVPLTNVITGFTSLQANIRSQVPAGEALVVGGWPAHRGHRVFVLALPTITGKDVHEVAVQFSAMEIPERLMADFGLGGLRTETASSVLSTVIPVDTFETLRRTFAEIDQADRPGEHLMWIGTASVNSTNGQAATVNPVLAYYGRTGVFASSVSGEYGNNLTVHGSEAEIDLGPYSGPTFTVTPVILNDRNSIDLAMQATVFWRSDETF